MMDLESMPAQPAEAGLEGLVGNIAARSSQALADLYEATVPRLYGIARAILGSKEDAEDAVCNVYIHVWNHAHGYDGGRGGVMGWLAVITHSRAIDLLRRRRDHVPLEDSGCMDSVSLSCDLEAPDRLVETLQRECLVGRALRELPAVQRQLIGLAFMQGLCHAEIAAATGMPIGTVKSHIRRALKRMHEMLAEVLDPISSGTQPRSRSPGTSLQA